MHAFCPAIDYPLVILLDFLKTLQQADLQVLYFFSHHRAGFLNAFFITITDLATTLTYAVPVVLLIIAYASKRRLLRQKSWLILVTLILTSTIADTIKSVVRRPRPFAAHAFIHPLVAVHTFSFPSGHTAEVALLAISVTFLFTRTWALLLVWLWALVIAYSRMYLGVHYPSDVLGSFVLSVLFGGTFIRLMLHLGFLDPGKAT